MRQLPPLSESELDMLLQSCSDDVDMSAVEATVQEVRALRAENAKLAEGCAKLLAENTQLQRDALSYRRRLGLAPHDFEPTRPGIEDVD